eukprot:7428_1
MNDTSILIWLSVIIGIQIILCLFTHHKKRQQKFPEIFDKGSPKDIRDLIVLSETELIKPKKIHCEDLCPAIIKYPYRICTFIIGFSMFFIIFIPLYLIFESLVAIYLLLSYLFCCRSNDDVYSKIVRDREYEPIPSKQKMKPLNIFCCGCVRRFMGECRIYLQVHKYRSNSVASMFVGFYQMMDYFSNHMAPWAHLNLLANEFGDFFPCLFGIGVAKRDDIIKFLHDNDIRKKAMFVMPKSATQTQFTQYATPFLSSNDAKCKVGREIIHHWLRGFDWTLLKDDTLFNEACPAKPFTTTTFSEEKHSKYIAQCFGGIFFYLATEHKLNDDDLKAFETLVFNPIHFLPGWTQFLLGGYYFERQFAEIYDRFRDLFAVYWKSKAFQSILKLYRQ